MPATYRRRHDASVPSLVSGQGKVTWAELETTGPVRRGRATWAELEVPTVGFTPQTIVGARVGGGQAWMDAYPGEFDRQGGDYVVENYEAWVRTERPSTLGSFRMGSNRTYYLDINDAMPNNYTARFTRDGIENRMPIISYRPVSWSQGNPSGDDTNIANRAANLQTFFDDNPGQNIIITGPHEPNNTDPPTSTEVQNWWRWVERFYTRMTVTHGLPIWEGTQAGQTTSAGLILSGPNLAGAAHVTNPSEFDQWYLTPATEPWGWEFMQMCCSDMYQGAAGGSAEGGVQSFRAFEELLGATPGDTGFYSWSAPKIVSQNAQGLVLLRGNFEFACDEADKEWPSGIAFFEQSGGGAVPSSYYASLGIPVTMPAWIAHMGDWLTDNPGELFTINFYDTSATTGSPPQPSGRGPHQFDQTPESAQAYLDFLELPVVKNGG